MEISRDPKFFLKVAFVFLVGMIVLPFAFDFAGFMVFLNPVELGVPFSLSYRELGFRWSFMSVTVTTPESRAYPPVDQMHVGTHWKFLLDYWGIYAGSMRSNILMSIFILQIAMLPIGLITYKKASKAWHMVPLLSWVISLGFLYFFASPLFYERASFGYYLSIVATIFVSIGLGRAAKWI